MPTQLDRAVGLREEGRAREALDMLLRLHDEDPGDPMVNYQCAWTYDSLGLERDAVPFYERAIDGGLGDDDLKGALLGLGSTHRALGDYSKALATLLRGSELFPEAGEFDVFLAMALYNVGDSRRAVRILLRLLAETSQDPGIRRYREAIAYYSGHLDDTW